MRNIWVILKKEYLTRVKNKTFIVMTFLAPILIAGFYGGTIYFATKGAEDSSIKTIYFSSENPMVEPDEATFDNFVILKAPNNIDTIKSHIDNGIVQGWVNFQDKDVRTLDSSELLVNEALSVVQISRFTQFFKNHIHVHLLKAAGIDRETLENTQVNGNIEMLELNDDGDMEKTSSALKSGIGFALAFVIYMFIFIYGSMVMRSAMEEKTNRIVEVIVSSVKPFELMMGKIIGVAFVGLTQFIAWITLSVAFVTALSQYITGGKSIETAEMSSLSASEIKGMELLAGLDNIPFGEVMTVFVLFFLGGYLLYSSIFAAIGASVNQETDVQQFMLPVSLPLVFSLVIAQSVVFQAPNGKLAQIFSMIPLSSPVVMSVRAPFGVPIMEIISSFVILLISFLIMVWLTARIYRIGILMYGKKPSWKDFLRWIRQS